MKDFYRLPDESAAWLDKAIQFSRETLVRQAVPTDREARFPRESLSALGTAGLLGLTISEAQGGAGQGPRTFAAVAESLAQACGSTGMIYVMHVCAAQVIAQSKMAQRAKVLADIAAGRHLTTLALSEKGSRSHFWAPVSREEVRGDRVEVHADKSFVTSAGQAQSYVVSTLSSSAKGPVDSSIYLIPADAKGLRVAGTWDGLGMRGTASAPLALEGVEVREGDRLSAPGGGFQVMLDCVLPWFQIGVAAICVGVAQAALAETTAHLSRARLEHLSQPLSALPNLRDRLARMRIEVDRSRAHLAYTLGAMEQPGEATLPAVLAAKAQAAEMAVLVTDLAMRTCGGAAYSKALPIERYFRDARAASVMAPTTDQLHDFLGKATLGLPLF